MVEEIESVMSSPATPSLGCLPLQKSETDRPPKSNKQACLAPSLTNGSALPDTVCSSLNCI